MPFYKEDEVRGIIVGQKVYCRKCMDEAMNKEGRVEVLTDKDVDEGDIIYVCDKCGELL